MTCHRFFAANFVEFVKYLFLVSKLFAYKACYLHPCYMLSRTTAVTWLSSLYLSCIGTHGFIV